MLVLIIAGFFSYLIISQLEKKNSESGMDQYMYLAFVLAPALIILLINLALAFFDAPKIVHSLLLALYFAIPLLMSRYFLEYSWKRSGLYGSIVILSIIVSTFILQVTIELLEYYS